MVKVYWYKISVVYDTITVTGYIDSDVDSVSEVANFINFDKCKCVVWREAPHIDAQKQSCIFEPTYKYIKVFAFNVISSNTFLIDQYIHLKRNKIYNILIFV
jgi:hypothetical protein